MSQSARYLWCYASFQLANYFIL